MTVVSNEPPLSDRQGWYSWLGARIKARRRELGLSQQMLADAIGGPRSSVSQIERGLRRVMATELRPIATVLQMTAGELVGEVHWDPPVRPQDGSARKITAVYCARTEGVELVTEVQWATRDRDDHVLWLYVRGATLELTENSGHDGLVYRLVKDPR